MRRIFIGTCIAIALTISGSGAAVAGQFSAPTNSDAGMIVRIGDSREREYYYRNRENNRYYQRSLREGYRLREQGWRSRYYHHRYRPAPYGYYAPPPAYYYPSPDPSFSFGLTLPIR